MPTKLADGKPVSLRVASTTATPCRPPYPSMSPPWPSADGVSAGLIRANVMPSPPLPPDSCAVNVAFSPLLGTGW